MSFLLFSMDNPNNNNFNNINNLTNINFSINNNNIANELKDDYIDLMKQAFYSKENIEYIQKMIIISIYEKSKKKYIVKKQKYEILIQLMNSFLQKHCNYLPYNYSEQIDIINNMIINYSTNELLKEIEIYNKFLFDQDTQNHQILPLPENVSTRKINGSIQPI